MITGFFQLFMDQLVSLLGANEDLHGLVSDYMTIIVWAAPLVILGLTLDYFVRIDTSAPSTITDFDIAGASDSSIHLTWTPTVEANFDYYQIFYASHINIDHPDFREKNTN